MNARIIHNGNLVDELCKLFDNAQASITILQYAFEIRAHIPTRIKMIANAILSAADRGVNIRILINTKHGVAPDSIDAVNLAEYIRHPNIHLYYHRSTQVMHAKAIIVDNDKIVIGSHNLTRTSLYSSLNISVIIIDHELARAMHALVFPLFEASKNG